MRRVSCLKRVNCWESFFFEKQRYLSLFLSLSLFLPLSHRVIIDDHDRDRGIGSSSSSSSSINSGGLLRVAAVAFDDELRRLLRCHHHCRIGVDGERRRNLSFSSKVWKRPWPSLDEVSINLTSTFSVIQLRVVGKMDLRRTMARFLVPMI